MTHSPGPPPYQQEWVAHGGERLGVHLYPEPGPRPDGPRPDGPAPAVVVWPAMGVPARFYRPLAAALRAHGASVTVADLRGTGASTPPPSRRSQYGYPELVGDVAVVLAALAPRLRDRRVVLLGHSLGGQVSLLHVARSGGHGLTGLALIAVGIPYWRSYPGRRRAGALAFTQTIHGAAALLRVWPGWRFGGRQARGVIRDWAYTARTGQFPDLPGVADLTTLRTPVLAVSFTRDRYTPASCVDHLVAKLPAAPVRREHHDGAADHFSWVRSPAAVAERVVHFARTGS